MLRPKVTWNYYIYSKLFCKKNEMNGKIQQIDLNQVHNINLIKFLFIIFFNFNSDSLISF